MSSPVLSVTARDIALAALRASGVIRPDEEPQAEDLATAIEVMNYLLKSWQAEGYHLWKQKDGVLFTNVGQQKYLLGPQGEEACEDADFIPATLTAAVVAPTKTITVDSTAGMLGAPNLFEVDPVGSTQDWTTGNTGILTANGGLTLENGAAAAGFADYSLAVTAGNDYVIDYGYTLGTSSGATFEVIDPTNSNVLDTATETGTIDGTLEFTATQNTLTFRFSNVSAVLGEDSILNKLEIRDTADGDKCGTKLDDGSRFWTTIFRVIDGQTLELAAEIPTDAASGLSVYTFSTIIDRPLRCYNFRSENVPLNNEIPIRGWSREEYFAQPTKNSQGTVVKVYYQPKLEQGEMYVWQTSGDVDQVVRFTYDAPILINTNTIDNPDVPSEWFNALKWNVANEIIPEYRVNPERAQLVLLRATTSLDKALSFDEEPESVYMRPDYEGIRY